MPTVIRNRRQPEELTEADVKAALARIGERDADMGREAEHVYGTLTWGEGPARLRRAGVQDWLWYQVPNKYLSSEVGYQGRLAETAAVLFDELGLDCYAAVCRSEVTAGVHAAFERSDDDGFQAMRRALDGSGMEPPDLDDFEWGQVMGIEEARAHAAVQDALEAAIADGDLVAGGRGWRARQRELTAGVLDGDHPNGQGQSWRTLVVAQRIEDWVRSAKQRSERVGERRAGLADRLLHRVEPPADVAERMAPVLWLLDLFGDEQPLTQAGYLSRALVVQVHQQFPWADPLLARRPPPRSEADLIILNQLREWLEQAGALRKRGRVLRRTKRGAAMTHDPVLAWQVLTGQVAPDGWDRFVAETVALMLVGRGDPIPVRELLDDIAADAAELGYRTGDSGRLPTSADVSYSFHESWPLLRLLGFGIDHEEPGGGGSRRVSASPSGEATMLAILRAAATGPGKRPW